MGNSTSECKHNMKPLSLPTLSLTVIIMAAYSSIPPSYTLPSHLPFLFRSYTLDLLSFPPFLPNSLIPFFPTLPPKLPPSQAPSLPPPSSFPPSLHYDCLLYYYYYYLICYTIYNYRFLILKRKLLVTFI